MKGFETILMTKWKDDFNLVILVFSYQFVEIWLISPVHD